MVRTTLVPRPAKKKDLPCLWIWIPPEFPFVYFMSWWLGTALGSLLNWRIFKLSSSLNQSRLDFEFPMSGKPESKFKEVLIEEYKYKIENNQRSGGKARN